MQHLHVKPACHQTMPPLVPALHAHESHTQTRDARIIIISIIITPGLPPHPTYRGIVLVQCIQKRRQFSRVDPMAPLRVSTSTTLCTTTAFPLQHLGRVVVVLHFFHGCVLPPLLPAAASAHDLGAAGRAVAVVAVVLWGWGAVRAWWLELVCGGWRGRGEACGGRRGFCTSESLAVAWRHYRALSDPGPMSAHPILTLTPHPYTPTKHLQEEEEGGRKARLVLVPAPLLCDWPAKTSKHKYTCRQGQRRQSAMKSNASTLHLSQPHQRHPPDGHHHKDLPPLQSTPSTADISAGSGPLDEGDTKHHVLALDATSSSPSGSGHFDGQHHSSSQQDLSAGGYGWYDNDEGMGSMSPYGRGGDEDDGDDSRGRGRGGDQHVSVLSRMETFREDMMERTSGLGKEEDEEGEKGQEERHLQQQQDGSHPQHHHHHHHPHRQSTAHESSSSSSRMHSVNINGRHHDHRNPDKEILFHLPQTNFSVMTRQFLDAGDVDEFLRRSSTSGENMHHHSHHHSHDHHHHQQHSQNGRKKRKKQPVYAALGLGGLRICQMACGGQHAEFLVCLCLNQETFVAWKRFSAFAQLYQDAHADHEADLLPATRRAWDTLESRRKWWRCLEIRYLAQKLTFLESFLGAFLTEVPSPSLLMAFASSDVTPKRFGNRDRFLGAEMHDMSGSYGGRNMVVNNSASQEELMLRQKVLQAGAVGGGGSEGEEEEGAGGR